MCYNRVKSMECFEDNVFLWNGGFTSKIWASHAVCCVMFKPPTISKWFLSSITIFLLLFMKQRCEKGIFLEKNVYLRDGIFFHVPIILSFLIKFNTKMAL